MARLVGSLENRILENSKSKDIEVGMGATVYMYSDRLACTVIEIISKCKAVIQRDKAICVGGSFSNKWELERDVDGVKFEIYCRNGIWKCKDSKEKVVIGKRDEYYDYSL